MEEEKLKFLIFRFFVINATVQREVKMHDGREDKNPWDRWFWQDYETDTGLRASSLTAQGLWMRMLSIMAKSKRKGFLLDGESKMETKTLSRLVGEPMLVIEGLLSELKNHEVYSQTDDGIIFNRRMERESRLSIIRSEAGKKGGRPKKQKKSKGKSKPKGGSASASAYVSASISFEEGVWGGIQEPDIAAWSEAYLACDVRGELKKMAEWLKANPDKKKIRYRRFIVNWLARTQDRSGNDGNKGRREPDPPQVGANTAATHNEQYWAEVRRLKAEGMEGQALTDALAKKAKEGKP